MIVLLAAAGEPARRSRNRHLPRRLEGGLGTFVITLVVALGCGGGGQPAVRNRPPLWSEPAGALRLDAAVRFTGTQFVIENHSDGLWRQVMVAVGRDGHPPAYRYTADAILGKRSVTIGALHFARPDGSRLSPFRETPDRWRVVATLADGREGFAEGTIE